MAGKNCSEEFKGEIVKAVPDERLTIGWPAKDFGVLRETVRNWQGPGKFVIWSA